MMFVVHSTPTRAAKLKSGIKGMRSIYRGQIMYSKKKKKDLVKGEWVFVI